MTLSVSFSELPASAMYPHEKGQPYEASCEGLADTRDETRPRPSTRSRIISLLFVSIVVTSLFFRAPHHCLHALSAHFTPKPLTIEQRVKNILSTTPLIDGHNDMPILIRMLYNNHIYNETFQIPFETGGLPGHVDLPRLRDGMNGGAFWSVYWTCPNNMTDFSNEIYAPIVQATLQQVDLVTRIQSLYPTQFSPKVNSSNALAAFKQGQLISPLGIEGLHQIGNSVANLRHFYDLGVRYVTLTHNCPNRFADAALWSTPTSHGAFVPPNRGIWGGVSPAGKKLIHEMNRIGMLVDLSHTSVDTQVDVLGGGEDDWEGSLAPVMYSHSSAYAVCPHPRNVQDHVLQLVKERKGVVMVNFAPDFISCVDSGKESGVPDFYPPNSTLAQVVRHVTYIGDLIGYDHVGLGSDFDGIPSVPEGLEDVSKYPDLVAALLKEGVSDEDAAKVVGGNILRVWKDVDAVALDLQAKGTLPLEDDMPSLKYDALEV